MKRIQRYILNLNQECLNTKEVLEQLVLGDADPDNKSQSVLVDNLFKSLVSTAVSVTTDSVNKSLELLNNIDTHLAFPELNFIYMEDYNKFDKISKTLIINIINQIIFHIPITNKTELVLNHVGNDYLVVDLYGVTNDSI